MATQRTPLTRGTRRGRVAAHLLDLSPERNGDPPIYEHAVNAEVGIPANGENADRGGPAAAVTLPVVEWEAAEESALFNFPPPRGHDGTLEVQGPEPSVIPRDDGTDFARLRREKNEIANDLWRTQIGNERRFASNDANLIELNCRATQIVAFEVEMR